MSTTELIKQLEVVATMGDRQIEALANILIDYYSAENAKEVGFKK